jgi:hypothetical protein
MIKTELAAMILDVAHRPDLSTKTDMFIRQAEAMIARDVRAKEQVVWGSTFTTANRTGAGLPTYTLPTDWLAERVIWSPDSTRSDPLESKSLGELRSLSSSAPPLWFAIRGLVIEFRGSPSDTDVIPYDYFKRMPAITAIDADNVLLNAHEELYLASALFYLHKYEQNLDLAQAQLSSFTHAVEGVNAEGAFKIGSASPAPVYNFQSRSAF